MRFVIYLIILSNLCHCVEVALALARELELERHERSQRDKEVEELRKRLEKMEQEKDARTPDVLESETAEEAAARRKRREWIMGIGSTNAAAPTPTVPSAASAAAPVTFATPAIMMPQTVYPQVAQAQSYTSTGTAAVMQPYSGLFFKFKFSCAVFSK